MMLSLRVALRYLFSRKSHNAVNILSIVSVVGVAVATAAMVIVLSVFNGFSDLAKAKLSMIDPDLLIAPAEGKVIAQADSLALLLSDVRGVRAATPIIREQALAVKHDAQMAVNILGMTAEAAEAANLDAITIDGEALVETIDIEGSPLYGIPTTMLSVGVANEIGLRGDIENFVKVYVPRRRGRINTANPMTAFRADTVLVAGIFRVDEAEYDTDMMIIPLATARHLLDYRNGEASGIQIFLSRRANASKVASEIAAIAGPDYLILDREQQQQKSFNMIKIEKWVTLLMLVFILIITSFNIVSAIYILRVEKAGNMGILRAMGATERMTRHIFAWQGRLITLAGGAIGLLTGSVIVVAQQTFGFVKLGSSDNTIFTVDAYPVRLAAGDLLIVAAIVVVIAMAASYVATFNRKN